MNINMITFKEINNKDGVKYFLSIVKGEKCMFSMADTDWVGEFIYEIYLKDVHVGYIAYSRWDNCCCLSCIYIFKNSRGKGIATAAIRKLLSMTKQSYPQFYGFVYKENRSAIEMYKKLGFKFLSLVSRLYDLTEPNELAVCDNDFYEFGIIRR